MSEFGVGKCPNAELAYTNLLYVNQMDFKDSRYVLVNKKYLFNIGFHESIPRMEIGPNTQQRQWARLTFSERVHVQSYDPFQNPSFLYQISFEMNTLKKGKLVVGVVDTRELAKILISRFKNQIFSVGQPVIFEYCGETYLLKVDSMEVMDQTQLKNFIDGLEPEKQKADVGLLLQETSVLFFKGQDAQLKLEGDAHRVAMQPLIQPSFKFDQLGIGGLEKEFSAIFRRAFASRTLPPDIVNKLGIQHIKGILLYGPPGTGKTLMARQIAKMLNTREPMIVNGPEILSKFVGQSEENIRKLFLNAEKEYQEKKDESKLHIIIFDELDAICKQRGRSDNTGVGDSIVNQLLSKIDGVEQLNNILIIGMTNRLDMIDEALLRPGRLELKLEISLPDEKGRLDILNIHLREMTQNQMLSSDVDRNNLAALTKNFSGAEISGLVKSAASYAINRVVKVQDNLVPDSSQIKVMYDDFKRALDEVKAAFGSSDDELQKCVPNGIIKFGTTQDTLEFGSLLIKQVMNSQRTPLVSLLLHGQHGCGKTALAATMALSSQFFYVKMISPSSMIGFSEQAKTTQMAKIFMDSYKSPNSVILIDDLERLLEWVPIGPRLSNVVLQTLLCLLKKPPPPGKKLLIIATCLSKNVLQQLDVFDCFNYDVYIPPLYDFESVRKVCLEINAFELPKLDKSLSITIKQLLMIIENSKQDENPLERFLFALEKHIK